MSTVKSQDRRIAELERIVYGSPKWVKIAQASAELFISCSTLRRRCLLKRYKEGKCWKWNYNKTERFFNVSEWRKASEEWS